MPPLTDGCTATVIARWAPNDVSDFTIDRATMTGSDVSPAAAPSTVANALIVDGRFGLDTLSSRAYSRGHSP
jgi:hypothetical protein